MPVFKISNKYSNSSMVLHKVSPNKILIVDDQEYNIMSMKVILKSLSLNIDVHVEHALSGEEALKMIVNDVEKFHRF